MCGHMIVVSTACSRGHTVSHNDRLNDHLTFLLKEQKFHHVQEEVSLSVKSWGKLPPCDYVLHSELTACVLTFNNEVS